MTRFRAAGRQREYIEDRGEYLARRVFFRGDLPPAELEKFIDNAEPIGHTVALRSGLMGRVLLRKGDVAGALAELRSRDQASDTDGHISFRYAFAEFCDAYVARDDDRLTRLRDEVGRLTSRTRSWIPIECFLAIAGRPLPDVPTEWLEPPEVIRQRWRDHLERYARSVNP
jgi:hypothetical protein